MNFTIPLEESFEQIIMIPGAIHDSNIGYLGLKELQLFKGLLILGPPEISSVGGRPTERPLNDRPYADRPATKHKIKFINIDDENLICLNLIFFIKSLINATFNAYKFFKFFLDRFVADRSAHDRPFDGLSVSRPPHGPIKFGRPFHGRSVWWPAYLKTVHRQPVNSRFFYLNY
ncbi:hypothetical protein BpHYR1_035054 [Brachionus plicatilis]|uniref:Uncharacterized protein n=1 Tax=Brachionus plicatilis TaxID=10195 RepID=A0A3M7SZF7_BRAPC|nr:hypothetical protein BpHYR1_035054 [Brachionus plicatilis]